MNFPYMLLFMPQNLPDTLLPLHSNLSPTKETGLSAIWDPPDQKEVFGQNNIEKQINE